MKSCPAFTINQKQNATLTEGKHNRYHHTRELMIIQQQHLLHAVVTILVLSSLVTISSQSTSFVDMSCMVVKDEANGGNIYSLRYSFGVYDKPVFEMFSNVNVTSHGWVAIGIGRNLTSLTYYVQRFRDRFSATVYNLNASSITNIYPGTAFMNDQVLKRNNGVFSLVPSKMVKGLIRNANQTLVIMANYNQHIFVPNSTLDVLHLDEPDFISVSHVNFYRMGDNSGLCFRAATRAAANYYELIITRSVLCFVAVCILIALVFYRKAPLISRRSPSPLICCVLAILYEGFSVIGSSTLAARLPKYGLLSLNKDDLQTFNFLGFAISMMNLAMVFSHMIHIIYTITVIRFLVVKNMYKMKIRLKHLRRLVSRQFFLIIGSVLSAIFVIPVGLTLLLDQLRVSTSHWFWSTIQIGNTIYFAQVVLMGIVAALAVLTDAIINRKILYNKGLIYFYTFADPLAFRTESIFCVIYLVLHIIVFSIYTLTGLDRFRGNVAMNVFRGIFVFVTDAVLLLVPGGGLGLIIEVFNQVKHKMHPPLEKTDESKDALMKILTDEEYFALFSSYAKSELSYENLCLWNELYPLKEQGSLTRQQAIDIYKRFLRTFAEYEVNVPADVRRDFEQMIQSEKTFSSQMQDMDGNQLFLSEDTNIDFFRVNRLYGSVLINLADTYSRFRETQAYIQMKEKRQFSQDMLLRNYNLPTDL